MDAVRAKGRLPLHDAQSRIDGVNTTVARLRAEVVYAHDNDDIVPAAIAACELQATGALRDFGTRVSGGRAIAFMDIVDDTFAYQIPVVAFGQVAIYTEGH